MRPVETIEDERVVLNSGVGGFGSGRRANATIGRAPQLIGGALHLLYR